LESSETSVSERLRRKLTAVFAPQRLEVIDDSERHRGHAGWREGGQTHFRVVMRSARLNGLSRVARSRAVHAALADELAQQVHALSLDVAGSEEA
jgi:BolA family transcriptional regulator, general stress-responsive regulator